MVRITANLKFNGGELGLYLLAAAVYLQVSITDLGALSSTASHFVIDVFAEHFVDLLQVF